MRFLKVTKEEEDLVNSLYKTSNNSVIRKRCLFVKLSLKGNSMKRISEITDEGWYSIWRFFNAWENAKNLEEKQKTLGIKPGRGAKNKLLEVKDIIPKLVRENNRNVNVVLSILEKEYQIKVCKITLQNFLKDTKI